MKLSPTYEDNLKRLDEITDCVTSDIDWNKVVSGDPWSSQLGVATSPPIPTATMTLGGLKFDAEKVRYDLIPPDAMEALATILTFGAKKYADRNWEKGMKWGRVFRAALGHLWDWHARKGNDPETGRSHLWHALCCVVFLVCYEMRNIGEDDRPNRSV